MRQLTKFSVILLLFIATCMCRAKITINNLRLDKTNSRFVEAVTNILPSCYGDRINPVGLAGDLPDTLFRELVNRYLIPAVLIDHSTRTTNNHHLIRNRSRQFRYQIQAFLIGASSSEKFATLMQEDVIPSIWWNHAASFVILDLSPGCKDSGNLLGFAWQLDVLDANVICINRKREILIYNYNPYTSQAPASWQKIVVVPGIDYHPFTLFGQRYGKNKNICATLRFEKTKDLAGYKIKIFVPQNEIEISHLGNLQTSSYNWKALRHMYLIISSVMNASLIHNVRPGEILYEDLDDLEESPTGMINLQNALTAYPHDQIGLVLISPFRGHKSQLNKILTVVDVASRIGLGIVYFITFIFLKLFLRQATMPAILNLFRITCDTGFINLRANTYTRIYLTSLLFFVVTMQGIYKGNLASLLTTSIPLRNINTINDVVDLGYKVYGDKDLKILIDNQDVLEHYIEIEREQCVEYLKNDSLGACLGLSSTYVVDQARELKWHVSNKFVVPLYIAFHIRWNWPLEHRFNIIIQKMVEADILKPWPERFNEPTLSEFEYDEKVMKNKDFKNIELHELAFAFGILGIGLVCATIAFIGELALGKFRSNAMTVRVEILRSSLQEHRY